MDAAAIAIVNEHGKLVVGGIGCHRALDQCNIEFGWIRFGNFIHNFGNPVDRLEDRVRAGISHWPPNTRAMHGSRRVSVPRSWFGARDKWCAAHRAKGET